jgi:hypothetical protein
VGNKFSIRKTDIKAKEKQHLKKLKCKLETEKVLQNILIKKLDII